LPQDLEIEWPTDAEILVHGSPLAIYNCLLKIKSIQVLAGRLASKNFNDHKTTMTTLAYSDTTTIDKK
jgi:hypothetical protein